MEKMTDFFAARVDGYDRHMMENIDGAREVYPMAAALLPEKSLTLLDLGCGTGLELEWVLKRFPKISITGIDITPEMLEALRRKYPDQAIRLICGDYFTYDLGTMQYGAAISVESLHHFSHTAKRTLYARILRAIKPGGVYIEADYIANTQDVEDAFFAARAKQLAKQGNEEDLWHVDTPCTIDNQLMLMREAGFSSVQCIHRWESTALFLSRKQA